MVNLPNKLKDKIKYRKESNSFRTIQVHNDGVDFYSNDYLGFSNSKKIKEYALELLDSMVYHNGSTGSRLISGSHPIHFQAEKMLAKFHGSESALLFNSGYDANLGLFSSVLQKGDVLLYDEFLHASCRDGIALSNAKSYKFKHNSLEDLECKILKFIDNFDTIYVAVESIYSMDGDSAPLLKLVNLCKKHNVKLIVDEAHSGGVFGNHGQGLIFNLGLENDVFARVHTFGKALGCHGAVVLGTKDLQDYLVNFSRSFIYTTALSPHSVATIISSFAHLEKNNSVKLLQEKISFFNKEIKLKGLENLFIKSNSAIQCCVISGNDKVKNIEKALQQKGYLVKAVLSPTVPKNKERLRICLHLFNSKDSIKVLIDELSIVLNG